MSDPSYEVLPKRGRCLLRHSHDKDKDRGKDKDKDKDKDCSGDILVYLEHRRPMFPAYA